MELFKEFLEICKQLNKIDIIPTLMGSVGLEYISEIDWKASDYDRYCLNYKALHNNMKDSELKN